ncbi:MAG TPA: four helix bundle protein [Anaerolineae bacterium]|nr:four helix bundle protein [Anaerolineae bacterium]
MNYEEWLVSVSEEITGDSLWKMEAYRLALFASDLGWHDVTKLMHDKRTVGVSDQLCRALGSISANLAEGYSRGTGKDRARFYEYALGSARESRDWYYKSRHVLSEEVTQHRIHLLTQIIRLLLTTVPQQRGHVLHEAGLEYQVHLANIQREENVDQEVLSDLRREVPLP